jgi:hypothetical protein
MSEKGLKARFSPYGEINGTKIDLTKSDDLCLFGKVLEALELKNSKGIKVLDFQDLKRIVKEHFDVGFSYLMFAGQLELVCKIQHELIYNTKKEPACIVTDSFKALFRQDRYWHETLYHVTGIDTNGKRFKIETNNSMQAAGINLYRGSVWEVDKNGKRKLVKRVWN